MNPNEFGIEVATLITPFITMMVILIVALWVKDLATKIAKGLAFKLMGPFKEGDKAILDGKEAIVVRIGLTMTVFGIYNDDKQYMWRYVPNERIAGLKLSKIIINSKDNNGSKQ